MSCLSSSLSLHCPPASRLLSFGLPFPFLLYNVLSFPSFSSAISIYSYPFYFLFEYSMLLYLLSRLLIPLFHSLHFHCRSFSFTFYRPSHLTFSPLHPRFPPSPSSPLLSSSASASSLPPSSLNCDLLKDHPGGPSAPLRTPFSIRPKKTDKWTR